MIVLVLTAAVLVALHYFFNWMGLQFAVGFTVGTITAYAAFRMHYGWWPDFNVDGDDAKNRTLPRL